VNKRQKLYEDPGIHPHRTYHHLTLLLYNLQFAGDFAPLIYLGGSHIGANKVVHWIGDGG
jgi:hypothetical protein